MSWEKIQPSLGSDENSRRIREALRIEKEKRFGEIGEIEADLGLSSGYLAKVCRDEASITLERLLRVLERMGVDAGRFFANAIGTRLPNDSLLEEVERSGEVSRRLTRIERVAHEVELSTLSNPMSRAIDAAAMVTDFVKNSGREQRRRLGAGQKYRHPAFAAAYLDHLDALRYDNAKEARQNAEIVAVKLIPQLSGHQPERITLLLKAVGIYASCLRQKGKWATAARALRFALAIARRHRLQEMIADLLLRAAGVLSDSGRFVEAKILLDEAFVLFYDIDSQEGLGMIMVDRGRTLIYLGEYQEAGEALERSLKFLQGDSLRTHRNRLAAYQLLALAYTHRGELEQAEDVLAQAVAESKDAGLVNQATVLWQLGVIAITKSSYEVAKKRLREAARVFEQLQDPSEALVALDLAKTLLLQDKPLEAIAIAMNMAKNLTVFRDNSVAEALISNLIQTATRGKLTVAGIEQVQEKLLPMYDRLPSKLPHSM